MTIKYQVDNGMRQRKNTKHPIRKMRKAHKNTSELIEYLSNKSYNILKLELEFTNGWEIKQKAYTELIFYTNSTDERNQLILKLLNVAGQGPIDVSKLEINYTYSFESTVKLTKINFYDIPSPDEFWSDEEVAQWRMDVTAIDQLNEKEEDESDSNVFSKDKLFEIKKNYPNWDGKSKPF